MMRWLADLIIRLAMRTPYRKGHLFHADGSVYMTRWSLFETSWLSARVHYIATPDHDRHLHDHPWTFLSIVLRGGYVECRPVDLEPCFSALMPNEEEFTTAERRAGSIAIRQATDRHRIAIVRPDTWTLFVYGPKRQWWGFFTPGGKVHSRDYPSVHEAGQAKHS
jgi:hypothetical protein